MTLRMMNILTECRLLFDISHKCVVLNFFGGLIIDFLSLDSSLYKRGLTASLYVRSYSDDNIVLIIMLVRVL